MAKDRLVVKGRVEVDSLLGQVEHSLQEDLHSGCTAVVLKDELGVLDAVEFLFEESYARRLLCFFEIVKMVVFDAICTFAAYLIELDV